MKTSLPIPSDEKCRNIVKQVEHNQWLEEFAQDMHEIRRKREKKVNNG